MKKIEFTPPISEKFIINENEVQVVSIPIIELKNIYTNEEMLAKRIAKKQLELDKQDLIEEPFDAQAWAQNWCEEFHPNIEITNGQYSTWFAKNNNGKKPPQDYYQLRLREITNENLGLAILHYFIRDEKGEMFFVPADDFQNTSYSPQRAVLTDWLLKNEGLKVACNFAASGNLMGFTSWIATQKEASELKEIQATGEIEQQ